MTNPDVPVSQAARDAAIAFARSCGATEEYCKTLYDGHYRIQAFARFEASLTRPAEVSQDREQTARETIRDALIDSAWLAGVTAGWNASQSDNPNETLAALQKSREGHLTGFSEARAIRAKGDVS